MLSTWLGSTRTDVSLRRESDDLLITLKTTGENLRVSNYFYEDGLSPYGYAASSRSSSATARFGDWHRSRPK